MSARKMCPSCELRWAQQQCQGVCWSCYRRQQFSEPWPTKKPARVSWPLTQARMGYAPLAGSLALALLGRDRSDRA